ncbi:hypothetical protein BJP41_07170 [Candidatus Williamhamiltonella defendens]|uniref:Lysozyme n=1 Tax=Candidatus Williamhamiltonella defendens TaxID=138072 RepID=A0A2D3T8M8_9ENTR|nr:hypothetical protein [Candidatus Hamiltonella defensa]ATW30135.1 hypothetical protein BJP41_07170 [Candidatus Hamiltonella defensa]ATW32147.1 hypothetical protein BJP42_07465 [Candidatus Hamiltonella defensa]
MNISPEGIEQIKAFEALRLKAYLCPGSRWTIGYGHTSGVKAGDTLTPGQAETFFREDITLICLQLDIAKRHKNSYIICSENKVLMSH